jgi:hypothetical protein
MLTPQMRQVTYKELRGHMMHEVGRHIYARMKGERSKLKLLGYGLDRSEKAEEGMATMYVQVMRGNIVDFAGLDGYLAVSLVHGLDGHPRDFRELYPFFENYYVLKRFRDGKEIASLKVEAQKDAWERCVRTFRGADCAWVGICNTKDMIYREGNMEVWNVIQRNPNEMIRFSIGKYDPSNDRHLWILNLLGINEDDLAEG